MRNVHGLVFTVTELSTPFFRNTALQPAFGGDLLAFMKD